MYSSKFVSLLQIQIEILSPRLASAQVCSSGFCADSDISDSDFLRGDWLILSSPLPLARVRCCQLVQAVTCLLILLCGLCDGHLTSGRAPRASRAPGRRRGREARPSGQRREKDITHLRTIYTCATGRQKDLTCNILITVSNFQYIRRRSGGAVRRGQREGQRQIC